MKKEGSHMVIITFLLFVTICITNAREPTEQGFAMSLEVCGFTKYFAEITPNVTCHESLLGLSTNNRTLDENPRESSDCRVINGMIVIQSEDLSQKRTLSALLGDHNDEYSHESNKRTKQAFSPKTSPETYTKQGQSEDEEMITEAIRLTTGAINDMESSEEYALLNCISETGSRDSLEQLCNLQVWVRNPSESMDEQDKNSLDICLDDNAFRVSQPKAWYEEQVYTTNNTNLKKILLKDDSASPILDVKEDIEGSTKLEYQLMLNWVKTAGVDMYKFKLGDQNSGIEIKSSGIINKDKSTVTGYLYCSMLMTLIIVYHEFVISERKMGMKNTLSNTSDYLAQVLYILFLFKPVIQGGMLILFAPQTAISNFGIGGEVLNKFMTGLIIYTTILVLVMIIFRLATKGVQDTCLQLINLIALLAVGWAIKLVIGLPSFLELDKYLLSILLAYQLLMNFYSKHSVGVPLWVNLLKVLSFVFCWCCQNNALDIQTALGHSSYMVIAPAIFCLMQEVQQLYGSRCILPDKWRSKTYEHFVRNVKEFGFESETFCSLCLNKVHSDDFEYTEFTETKDLKPVLQNGEFYQLDCGHCFHEVCLFSTQREKKECVMCSQSVPEDTWDD